MPTTRRNGVTNGVTSPFVTQPPTRPDPTRPISVVTEVCGVSGHSCIASNGDLGSPAAHAMPLTRTRIGAKS